MPGEKKAWAKKARRRHSVAPTKFTSHDTGKADTTSVTQTLEVETHDVQLDLLADKQTEEVLDALTSEEAAADNTAPEEEIVEELEVVEEQPEEVVEEQLEQVDETSLDDSDEDLIEEANDSSEEETSAEGNPEDMKPAEGISEDEDRTEDVPEDEKLTEDESENNSNEEADQELADGGEEEPESDAEDSVSDSVEEISEEVAEEAAEDSEEATEDLDEYVDELSRELDAIEESEAVEEESENELPAEPAPTPAAAARQKPTKRKKPAPRYRYIKSPSLEQAFRNLLRLDAGAAWRATRIPLVAFFLCFALLALAIADQAPAIDSFNATINALVHGTRGMLDGFFVTITTLGDLLPMTALCLIVCAILVIARKWDSLAFFATNVLLAVVCVQALKFIFAVPRPGAETLVPIPGSFSFPSAHSFCSLIVLGMIGLLIFRALNRKGVPYNVAIVPGIILVIFAILIGISRIYVGVHWPSDVLGGWLLAGMWLPFASALYTVGARKR